MSGTVEAYRLIGGDACGVVLEGEHDLGTTPDIARVLEATIQADGCVVVDLTDASFIDSTVLGVLIGQAQQAEAVSCAFGLVIASGSEPRLVADVVCLEQSVRVFRTPSTAFTALLGYPTEHREAVHIDC